MFPNTCQTVQIQGTPSAGNPTGVTVINAADFDADTMTLATPAAEGSNPEAPAPAAPEAPAPAAPEAPAPEAPAAKSGKKVVAPWAA